MASTINTPELGPHLLDDISDEPLTITSTGAVVSIGLGVAAIHGLPIAAWTVTNQGLLDSAAGAGVQLDAGGTVANTNTILGGDDGIRITGGPGTVANTNGSITGTTGVGVELAGGGTVSNSKDAAINSDNQGILISNAAGNVVNDGIISSKGDAVTFTGTGANELFLGPNSVITGAVIGSTASGSSNTLALGGKDGSGTIAGLSLTTGTVTENNSTFAISNFGSLEVGPGVAWTMTGDNTLQSLFIDETGTFGNGVLTIANGASLTVTDVEADINGTLKLAGGSFTDTQGLGLGPLAQLIGFGTVTTGATSGSELRGPGIVIATGGTLEFTQLTNQDGDATSYVIDDVAGSELKFDGAVGNEAPVVNPTVTFDTTATGGLGILDLTGTTLNEFHAIVNEFVFGTKIQVLNADHVTLTGGTTLNVFDAANASLGSITLAESHTGATFSVDTATDTITTDLVCYVAGTRILTATGERMVESLLQGDIVLTLSGGELGAYPVKWIGRRRIDLTAHPRPETVMPVRIQRGAFAANMPHTDLLLSPDHAVFVDGKLICARQLINGTTIRAEKGWTAVEYFHVELDAHAILLAEGLPAESYLNTGNRGFFANSGEPLVLHPDLTDETDYPTREAGSCAPFVWDEASVRPVWQRLAERAEALGQPAPKPDTTTDPALHLVAKGRTVRPLYGENGLYIFALPKGATEVQLVSRAAAPTDVRPWLEDRRCLGVYVERILLRGASEVREVPLDHPGLSRGWWAVERNGTAMRRWTGGDAVVPLPPVGGPTMLEIRADSAGMSYLTDADLARRVA